MLFTPIKPMLVTMGTHAFDHQDWIFEPKWDGWRIFIHKEGKRIEVFTRSGRNVTHKFPEASEMKDSIHSHSAILDCEGVCFRGERPVFDDFAYRGRLSDLNKIDDARQTNPATFIVFDVLFSTGDHRNDGLLERKKVINEIIEPSQILAPTMYIHEHGKKLSSLSVERDLEGIVAKRIDTKYVTDTRSADWLKIKNFKTIDTVILGYRTSPQFALVVGLHFRTVKNKPVAVVEFGFTVDEKLAFLKNAEKIHTVYRKGIQYIDPQLCCKIQYLERTDTHHLRTTSFKGFVFDKKPEECCWHYY
ncbi:ATP-dependent DNA ligase [Paenibacillus nasutitermitis]|uniref:DNA ligase n=1 Tax=Paenibacillus nasutitermitis TaxID=1652958 RepID=A0A917DRP9_9BACL|nr:RNA ligase family protein [Paenibacillus nasutitermitis]GGD60289.1 DNA ligase [Paenibacillus nasutitermitis]